MNLLAFSEMYKNSKGWWAPRDQFCKLLKRTLKKVQMNAHFIAFLYKLNKIPPL